MARASKAPLQLSETATFITHAELSFKVQPRLFSGSTRGNVIGPLAKPDYADAAGVWQVLYADKKKMFGDANLPLPGGTLPHELDEEDEEEKKQKTRVRNSDLVPAFFHESPQSVAFEIAHSLQCMAILDLACGSGHYAFWAIKHRVPYCGIVFNEHHEKALMQKLVSRTLTAMCDSNDHELYDSSLANEVIEHDKDNTPAENSQEGGRGRGRGGRGRGRGGGKPKPEPAAEGAAGDSRDDLLKMIQDAAAPTEPQEAKV